MVSRHAGHYVQIWRPLAPRDYVLPKPSRYRGRRNEHPNYATVEGRSIQRTVSEYPHYAQDGWFYVSRELDKRRAKRYARAYRRAGFKTRIVLRENSGKITVVM